MNLERAIILLVLTLSLLGCGTPADRTIAPWLVQGELGQARTYLSANLTQDRGQRSYLLDRMKLAVVTLEDGYTELAQTTFQEVYDVLRTQGINEDKTVASVVINEDLKFWKGEPFEQALAMYYYSAQQATLGSWDNVRAAAGNALFKLRDFGTDAQGQRIDTQSILQRSIEAERAATARRDAPPPIPASEIPHSNRARKTPASYAGASSGQDYLNSGYAVRESNFTMGYLMRGLANLQLGRLQEADDYFAVALQLNPNLRSLVHDLKTGRCNTLLAVAYGLGPEKVAYGPDNALSRFQPLVPSDEAYLLASVSDQPDRWAGATRFPVICDVNRMAADHMWNNLEDVRQAKSLMGSLLMAGGILAAGYGIDRRSDEALYAGLGALMAGAFLKAGAHADTRYCDAMPQRFYLAAVRVDRPGQLVNLQIEGKPYTKLVLAGLEPPDQANVQFRSVRLPGPFSNPPPAWAVSGRIAYGNDQAAVNLPAPQVYPYILGGRDLRSPSATAMADYQRVGYLQDMTYLELQNLYRAEGIKWTAPEWAVRQDRHLLEGGRLLLTPQAGTTGFARLMGQDHPAYVPTSEPVRSLLARQARSTTAAKLNDAGSQVDTSGSSHNLLGRR